MDSDLDIRDVLNIVGLGILIILVIPFVIFAVPGVVGADGSHVVLSGSMEPAISPGDVVIVNDVAPSNIEQGDIITYQTGSSEIPTTHRVIEVLDEGESVAFRTKGDANEDPDATPVAAANLEGRLLFTIPFIGHIIAFAGQPMGAAIFMGVPLGLLILTEVWSFVYDGKPIKHRIRESITGEPTTRIREEKASNTARDEAQQHQEVNNVEAQVAESSQTETGDETYTLSRTDLELTVIVMGVFAAYAIWTFYQRWIVAGQRSPIPLSVAIATTGGLLLLLAAYVASPEEPETTSNTQDPQKPGAPPQTNAVKTDQTDVLGESALQEGDLSKPAAVTSDSSSVSSIVELIDTAISTKTPITWRPWRGTFQIRTTSGEYVYTSAQEQLGINPERQSNPSPQISSQESSNGANRPVDGEESSDLPVDEDSKPEPETRVSGTQEQGEDGHSSPADLPGGGDDD